MDLKAAIFGNQINKLQEQSKTILDVFTKTVTDLTEVNNEADQLSKKKEEEKKKLEEEITSLGSIKADNQKVIEKINKLFE